MLTCADLPNTHTIVRRLPAQHMRWDDHRKRRRAGGNGRRLDELARVVGILAPCRNWVVRIPTAPTLVQCYRDSAPCY